MKDYNNQQHERSTALNSQAITHPSTNRLLPHLTSPISCKEASGQAYQILSLLTPQGVQEFIALRDRLTD